MYCDKCKKEISDNSKFCRYCGKKTSIYTECENISKKNKYTIKRYYGILLFILLPIIVCIPTCYNLEAPTICLILFVVVTIIAFFLTLTEYKFECPNCKEQIEILEKNLKEINDTTKTCQCLKCNKDLILNTIDKTVYINQTIDEKKAGVNISTPQIEELYNLKVKGIITEEEFENKKKEILSRL